MLVIVVSYHPLAHTQNYIRMTDASGINTDAYQAALQKAADSLVAVFPKEFKSQFKVYDFGFYLHNESYSGGYPEAFAQAIADVSAKSPYYLLFGKQTDHSGVYTKFWVDLKLPTTDSLSCLPEELMGFLGNQVLNVTNTFYSGESSDSFAIAEIKGMEWLKGFVKNKIVCCSAPENGEYYCGDCPLEDDLITYLQTMGFEILDVTDMVMTDTSYVSVSGIVHHHGNITVSIPNRNYKDVSINNIIDSLTESVIDSLPYMKVHIYNYEDDCMSVLAMIGGSKNNALFQKTLNSTEDESDDKFAELEVIAFKMSGLFGDKLAIRYVTNVDAFGEKTLANLCTGYGPNILEPGVYHSVFCFDLSSAQDISSNLNSFLKAHVYHGNSTAPDATFVEPFHNVPVVLQKLNTNNFFIKWLYNEPDYWKNTVNRTIYKISTRANSEKYKNDNNKFKWKWNRLYVKNSALQPFPGVGSYLHPYISPLFDILNVNKNILISYEDGDYLLGGSDKSTLKQARGWTNKVYSRGIVYIDKVYKGKPFLPDPYTQSTYKYQWGQVSVFLHETLTHIHYTSNWETNLTSLKGGPTYYMQQHFLFKASKQDHPANPKMYWPASEKDRLQDLINSIDYE